MDTLSYKTLSANKETAEKKWWVVDAQGEVLGRMASKIAKVLRGKYKTNFTPHADCGDYVIIVNAGKIVMTGNKMEKREIFSHTGFPGGIKSVGLEEELRIHPERVIENAVKGMIPRNRLGRAVLSKLRVYAGNKHPHEAQNPKLLSL